MRLRHLTVIAVILGLATCTDREPLSPERNRPLAEIFDAVHSGGNAHFFFLPPLASAPNAAGAFDGSLSPVVQICEWTGATCVSPPLAEFTRETGPGSETVRVEPDEGQYIVNWHTGSFNLKAGGTYRISVLVEVFELGHIDAMVVRTGRAARDVDSDRSFSLVNGRTVPIKFRIEVGAVPRPPVASFTVAGSTQAGSPTTFDASGSSDPQGSSLTFSWDFGDAGRGGAPRIPHIYAEAGDFTATLLVTNAFGLTSAATRVVHISAPPAPSGRANVLLSVVDGAGQPLPDVQVDIPADAATGATGPDGRVQLSGVATGSPRVIHLTKSRFVEQFVRLEIPSGVAEVALGARMVQLAEPQMLADAESGGRLTSVDGVSLELPGNALVDSRGLVVRGSVSITLTPIDVSTEQVQAFPGSFGGIVADGSIGPIISLGVADFLLEREGELLQLAPGKQAVIDIPIFTSGTSRGEQVPVWSLSRASGLWVAEGVGTVVSSSDSPSGLALRAQVSHFSPWNADRFISGAYSPLMKCVDPAGQDVICLVRIAASAGPAFDLTTVLVPGGQVLFLPPDVPLAVTAVANGLGAQITIQGASGEDGTVIIQLTSGIRVAWIQIAASGSHTCGIISAGQAFCWGWRDQVGTPLPDLLNPAPVAVSGGLTFSTVSASKGGFDNLLGHTCGVTTGGDAYCWGTGTLGQLGNGSRVNSVTRVLVSGGLTFVSVSAGLEHSCGVATGGGAYCWGRGAEGQLGTGAIEDTPSAVPVPVTGGLVFVSVTAGTVARNLIFTTLSAGSGHTCGITTAGEAYCWGENFSGQLGTGDRNLKATPALVAGGLTFAAVSGGGLSDHSHTCGVTTAGAAYCWGDNRAGQLGNGSFGFGTVSLEPSPVVGDIRFVTVTAGEFHSCGVAADGAAYCWGDDQLGELGRGESSDFLYSLTPARVAEPIR